MGKIYMLMESSAGEETLEWWRQTNRCTHLHLQMLSYRFE